MRYRRRLSRIMFQKSASQALTLTSIIPGNGITVKDIDTVRHHGLRKVDDANKSPPTLSSFGGQCRVEGKISGVSLPENRIYHMVNTF